MRFSALDGIAGIADRGDEYLVAAWPRYESMIAALGPIGVVTFFGPLVALLLIIGAVVVLFDTVLTLAEDGHDFLARRIPERVQEAAVDVAWGCVGCVCAILAIPIVLCLAAVGVVVTFLREKGRIE